MKTTGLRTAMALAIATLVGCSGSDVSEVAESSAIESFGATSITPPPTITPASEDEIKATLSGNEGSAGEKSPNEIEPFRNPFAPPKAPPPPPVVEEPEPEPEPELEPEPESTPGIQRVRTPPSIRLLGFMNIGEPKVLVSFRDELQALAIGDMLEDLKVVKIESPELTMRFDEREIKLSLFDQVWQHTGNAMSASNSSRNSNRSRPSRTTSAPPTSRVPSRGATSGTSQIPGFGPNDGQGPGYQPPATSEFTSPLEGDPGNDLPGLPGFGGEGSSDDGALPDLPGIDGDDFDAGGLPGLPVGF
ncbi:MAG: hypothetical protein H8E66_13180 [Planctomycetes bacterium]|nr:hypothetical protein [Planctomycetota bacterium]